MQECRVLEKRAYDLFMQNLIKGTSHLALGQEAVAAGFGLAMQSGDYTFCTYRGHNHTLVRGVSMTEILGELMGNASGLMRGKGGSMHLTSVKHNMMGSYAIIGAHLTIANGAAWSAQYRGTDPVAVCFFGDGTAVRALDLARKGGGPSLIEAQTYRHGGHSRADPGKYRPDEEVQAWLAKDPIPLYRQRLQQLGISEGELKKIDDETKAQIDAATETARNAPPTPLELADKDVWADGGSAWRN